jgi:hypothetical protein
VDGPGLPALRLTVPDSPSAMLHVDGVRAPLARPGQWSLRRRSRRIRAAVAGRDYELRPVSGRRSRLSRDGTVLADARGGFAGYLPVHLSFPGRNARVTWHQGCDETDVAVGYALTYAYGAGSPGLLVNLAWAIFDFFNP